MRAPGAPLSWALLPFAAAAACAATTSTANPERAAPRPAPSSREASPPARAPALMPPSAARPSAAPAGGADASPVPCGDYGCTLYDSPRAALAAVLADDPLVLAVGEMHALQGTEKVASATRRFTQDLLPLLAGRATDLVLELWVEDPACKRAVRKVEKKQAEVTAGQAAGNQNDFVALGNESKQLGIQPHVLELTCEDYERIAKAGEDDVVKMLETIATLTEKSVGALVDRNREAAPGKLVLTYGGAIHNDLEPVKGARSFSFGPALAAKARGRYVALDLVVPELIHDSRLWQAQPWRTGYDPDAHPDKATLYHPRPGEYALIFPRSSASADEVAAPATAGP